MRNNWRETMNESLWARKLVLHMENVRSSRSIVSFNSLKYCFPCFLVHISDSCCQFLVPLQVNLERILRNHEAPIERSITLKYHRRLKFLFFFLLGNLIIEYSQRWVLTNAGGDSDQDKFSAVYEMEFPGFHIISDQEPLHWTFFR